MGHKVHPLGFRLGLHYPWQSRWFDPKHYTQFLQEDLKIREAVRKRYPEAGVSRVELERQGQDLSITIHTSRPGVVIGRDGRRIEEMRQILEELTKKRIRLNVAEIYQAELDARLLARNVAEQLERRVAFRRVIRQAGARCIQAGAKGVKIIASGRLAGREIASRTTVREGRMPLQTLRADIDFGLAEAHTKLGRIGVKVWIYKGDILPQPQPQPQEEASPQEEHATAETG